MKTLKWSGFLMCSLALVACADVGREGVETPTPTATPVPTPSAGDLSLSVTEVNLPDTLESGQMQVTLYNDSFLSYSADDLGLYCQYRDAGCGGLSEVVGYGWAGETLTAEGSLVVTVTMANGGIYVDWFGCTLSWADFEVSDESASPYYAECK